MSSDSPPESGWKGFSELQKLRYKQSPGQYKGDPLYGKTPSQIFLDHTKTPYEVMFDVDIDKLPMFIDQISNEVPIQTLLEASHEVSYATITTMMELSPSSLKSGRGYRGPPLRHSIKTDNMRVSGDEASFETGPTKKVDGHDLGLILEKGSNNQVIIKPKKGKYLKFIDKNGIRRFEKQVIRGIIPPQHFVRKTASIMGELAPKIFVNALSRIYGRLKT